MNLGHAEACPAHSRRERSYGHELSAAIKRQSCCTMREGSYTHATAFAVTAKDYPWISFRTSSWKPLRFEGNFRRPCPEISL